MAENMSKSIYRVDFERRVGGVSHEHTEYVRADSAEAAEFRVRQKDRDYHYRLDATEVDEAPEGEEVDEI